MVSGCAAITANNAFYGAWIDHETGTFYGGPYAVGGLIGRPWQLFSLPKLPENTCTVKGFPVCRVGGIFAWDDCVRYLMAGSHITGLCSAVYFRSSSSFCLSSPSMRPSSASASRRFCRPSS